MYNRSNVLCFYDVVLNRAGQYDDMILILNSLIHFYEYSFYCQVFKKKINKLSINVSFLFIIKYFNFYNFWTKNKSLKLYWSFVSTLLAKPYQIISTYFGSHAVLFAVKWLTIWNGCRLCTMDVSTFLFYLQLCDEWCIFFPENSELYSQCYRFNKQMCLYVDWSKANTSEYSGTHLKVKKCFCVYYWYCVFNVRVSAAFLTFLGIPSWGAFSVGFFLIGGQNFRFTSFSWPRRKIRNAAKA